MMKLIGIEEHFVTAGIRAGQHLLSGKRVPAGSIEVKSRIGSMTWASIGWANG
jgi:hypothetical protein